jgi:hypothetical protein
LKSDCVFGDCRSEVCGQSRSSATSSGKVEVAGPQQFEVYGIAFCRGITKICDFLV